MPSVYKDYTMYYLKCLKVECHLHISASLVVSCKNNLKIPESNAINQRTDNKMIKGKITEIGNQWFTKHYTENKN